MNKKDAKLLAAFNDIKQDERIINSTIEIQNNINIYANSKIIAIAVAKKDISLCVVARTIAEVYAIQNQSTLLIDCDMYNPSLNDVFNKEFIEVGLNDIIDDKINLNKLFYHFSNNLDVVFAKKTNYPTDIFKSKQYNDFINMAKEKYEHILLVMPELTTHQDILMNKNIITATLLIARKNKSSKKDLFDFIEILKENSIPYVGTIYLK